MSFENEQIVKKLKVFEIERVVDDFYLRANAFAHFINVQLMIFYINEMKAIIRTASEHVKAGFR